MVMLDKLSTVYNKLEDKWFDLLDFLDSKGIPVYAYANFLEEKGIPSFPFTIAVIVLLLVLIYSFASIGATFNASITVNLTNELGESLDAVQLTFTDSSGTPLLTKTVSNGDLITLKNVRLGEKIKVTATKENFKEKTIETVISDKSFFVSIEIQRNFKIIDAFILLTDSETNTVISNATITLDFGDQTITGVLTEDKKFKFSGIRADTEAQVIIKADGYEDYSEIKSFTENETKNISLNPSIIGLQGKTNLLIEVFDNETKEMVKDVNITIIDDSTESIIAQTVDEDGAYSEKIDSGTVVNIIVEKQGYMRYELSGLTLREDEHLSDVYLEKGGQEFLVNVVGRQNLPISNATVQLYDEFNSLLDSKETGFGGSVIFTNLDPNKNYYVTAFKQGFLSAGKKTQPTEKEITLSLEKETTVNVSNAKITVIDTDNNPASGATLKFYEEGNETLPLGVPAIQTDAAGYLEVKLPAGKNILIKAMKSFAEGEARITTETGKDAEAKINLSLKKNIVKLLVKDFEGNPVTGNITIESVSGETLFDGNIENGVVYFLNKNNKEAIAKVTLKDGTTFKERITIKDKSKLTLTVLTAETDLTPKIEFVSVLNEKGEKVKEIEKENYYWLEFMTSWPKGNYVGGVHVRTGNDELQFVDSDEVGILGFQADADDFAYGSSYSYKGTGNEALDRFNKGKANEFNKWVELYFKNPENTEIIKVKVKAKENTSLKEFKVKFRAWSELQGKFFREPYDAVLGQESFNLEKSGLYAETKETTIKIAEAKPSCTESYCVDASFYEPTGIKVKEEDFNPVIDKVYALELRITATKDLKMNILFGTNKLTPNLYFTGIQIDSFTGFPDNESQEVEKTIESITIKKGATRKIRLYFKGIKEENAFINAVMNAAGEKKTKSFYFNLNKEHEMKVEVAPQTVNINEDFTVRITDSETSEFVSNARIKILDQKNRVVRTLIGTNSRHKGLNGEYLFKGNLEYGFYKIEINAKGYKKSEAAVAITKEGLIELTKNVSIDLKKGEKTKTATINLTNKSKFNITNLSFEFKKKAGSQGNFVFKASLPERIGAAQTLNLQVTAEYQGDIEERAHEETELIVRGMIENAFPVETKQTITANYNKPLPENCISFDKDELKIDLYSEKNARENATLTIKNNCNETLTLNPDIQAEKKDTQLSIKANKITLKPDEEKEVTVDIENKIQRSYYRPVKRSYSIYWIAPQITRSIPLIVNMRSLYFSLQTSDNLTIYTAPDEKTKIAKGFAPLYIRNTGFKPIEQLSFSVQAPQGMNITVIPNEQGAYFNGMPSNALYPTTTSNYDNGLYQNYNQPGYASMNYVNNPQPYSSYTQPSILPSNLNELPYNPYFTPSQAVTPFNQMIGLQQRLYSKALMPGQELVPVKTVTAIIRNVKNLNKGPYLARINISGVIDGKRYYLKTVNVWINVSGTECLKAYPVPAFERLKFESTELNGQTITKKIKLKNECSETLRGLKVEPKEISGNELSLESRLLSIAPNQEIITRIVLKKTTRYASKEYDDKIIVSGITTATIKKINSNPLSVHLQLGETPKETGKKTEPINIPYCDNTNGNKEVSFPLQSKSDCSQGYCDAVTAVKEIAEKIKYVYELAVRRARDGSNSSTTFRCPKTKNYCPYSALGVPITKKTIYLSNDIVNTQLLKDEISKLTSDVKGYTVTIGDTNPENITTAFAARQITLNAELKGCGKYKLEFDGTMKNAQGKLIEDEQAIIVKVKKIKGNTEECLPEIYNIMNFLPEDKGLKANTIKAKPGTVFHKNRKERDIMDELTKSFSSALFGDEKRVKEKTTNSMEIKTKDLGERTLELSIEGNETSKDLKKVTLTATINDLYVNSKNNSISNQIKEDIIQAIKSIALAHQGRDMCITKDKKTFKFGSLGEELKLQIIGNKINGKGIIKLSGGQDIERCTDFTVRARVPGKVELKANMKDKTPEDYGITIKFKDEKGKELKTNGEPPHIKLNETKDKLLKGGVFEGKAKLCVSLNKKAFKSINNTKNRSKAKIPLLPIGELLNTKIYVTGKHEKATSYSEPYVITPMLYSIHPEKLIEIMPKLKDDSKNKKGTDYYLTLEWKDAPEEIDEKAFKKYFKLYYAGDNGINVAGSKTTEEKIKINNQVSAIGAFTGSCVAISFIGNSLLKAHPVIVDPFLDCGIPASIGLSYIVGTKGALKIIGGIPKVLAGITLDSLKFIGLTNISNKIKDYYKDQQTAMTDAAHAEILTKATARAIRMRNSFTKWSRIPSWASLEADRLATRSTEQVMAKLRGIKLDEEIPDSLRGTIKVSKGTTFREAISKGKTPILIKLNPETSTEATEFYNDFYINLKNKIKFNYQQSLKEKIKLNPFKKTTLNLAKETDLLDDGVKKALASKDISRLVESGINKDYIKELTGTRIEELRKTVTEEQMEKIFKEINKRIGTKPSEMIRENKAEARHAFRKLFNHTKNEARDILLSKGYEPPEIQRILSKMKAYNYENIEPNQVIETTTDLSGAKKNIYNYKATFDKEEFYKSLETNLRGNKQFKIKALEKAKGTDELGEKLTKLMTESGADFEYKLPSLKGKPITFGNGLKNLILTMGVGILAQQLGMEAFKDKIKKLDKQKSSEAIKIAGPKKGCNEEKTDGSSLKLKKYYSYKLVIKGENENKTYCFHELNKKNDFKSMEDAIKNNKELEINTDAKRKGELNQAFKDLITSK